MDYKHALSLLTGRCKTKRRLCNNTTLVRLKDDVLAVRLHSTNVLELYPDGKFVVSAGSWHTYTTKDRINRFIPGSYGVYVDSSRYGGSWVLRRGRTDLVTVDGEITVLPDGTVIGGGPVEEARRKCRELRNRRRREQHKTRYWIIKARQGSKSRKPLTPALIHQESNVTIRTAMIKVYGIERFLTEIGAEATDKEGGYALLKYPVTAWQGIRALRMVCPSTKTVYIHPVPPDVDTVGQALDWMFGTPGFRERLLSES